MFDRAKIAWIASAPVCFLVATILLRRNPYYAFPDQPFHSPHPIDDLVVQADDEFRSVLNAQRHNVKDAAAEYRRTRGRHPPPYFDQWFLLAKEHQSPVIESMYDQIYHDLEPFWALAPSDIRGMAESWPLVLATRNGKVERRTPLKPAWANWMQRWTDMLEAIPQEGLPDVNLPFNLDDEPHIFVPRETINEYLETAKRSKNVAASNEAGEWLDWYARYGRIPSMPTFEGFSDTAEEEDNVWELARQACYFKPAETALHQDTDFSTPPVFPTHNLPHMHRGFVSNWTSSMSACHHPSIRNIHGYFINPKHGSRLQWHRNSTKRWVTQTLFPVFSPAKLQDINNDIVVPAPMYWGEGGYTMRDDKPWRKKSSTAIWRGGAKGGFNNETNWTRMHRHRFISLNNGTQVEMTVASTNISSQLPPYVPGGNPKLPHNFPLPNPSLYPLAYTKASDRNASATTLHHWLNSTTDARFVDLSCWPPESWYQTHGFSCSYTSPYFTVAPKIHMESMFDHKYLPDVDGHGYSGRFRSFLMSTSVPIKATVWTEWHTSRIVPWRHFVPMDVTNMDWWGILEYFVGFKPADGAITPEVKGHDKVAQKIAMQGRDWAKRTMRQEDMVLYMWRLVLEFARVCDDNRERMGWVADLRGEG